MLQNIKANIIPQITQKQIKINRRRIDNQKEIYEISIDSFCKLVDGLTRGQIIRYISYYINDDKTLSIDPKVTIYRMMVCVLDRLKQNHIEQIFGKDAEIDSIEKFMFHINKCKWYTTSSITLIIKTYIKNNYLIVNNKLIRKLNKGS